MERSDLRKKTCVLKCQYRALKRHYRAPYGAIGLKEKNLHVLKHHYRVLKRHHRALKRHYRALKICMELEFMKLKF